MNNSSSLLFVAVVGLLLTLTVAFAPTRTHHQSVGAESRSALYSIIFEPPVEENCELDGSNCEESIFDRKKREKSEANQAIMNRYQMEHGVELTDIDLMESIDQYQNAPTGGNLIPGMSLSALCEDD
eukprot:CAMPEP_0172555430 /NCGR_PEP_ID=MMETSP1067-20121228/58415_1 /TAXON_ID=265564 ORGANISM="Thalassiosira punctigera, Strain Tpunct2005C2" /NCGR_SAMPLE_ID=MMETSP1067 /ASSEMBLY_ACC=CAM_ASM_000444 /LENGTH=126 /DNA_ID=CAMNT_0013343951 /DNA_START=61 /DNA_END=441 /DNA_ORIENTATION=+